MTKRITYVSRFSKPMDERELRSLGEAAANNNKQNDVTGFLRVNYFIRFSRVRKVPWM